MAIAMIVDDEDSVRKVVSSTLRTYGFLVLEATGIQDAERVIREHEGPLDLLIVNHALADGVGHEAVERICRERPDTKVLRYSGYPAEHLKAEGDLIEGEVFIQKPFRAGDLIECVREVLGWLPERQRRAGG